MKHPDGNHLWKDRKLNPRNRTDRILSKEEEDAAAKAEAIAADAVALVDAAALADMASVAANPQERHTINNLAEDHLLWILPQWDPDNLRDRNPGTITPIRITRAVITTKATPNGGDTPTQMGAAIIWIYELVQS